MSATQATVTSTQVAVRYRRNVGSLSIDMSTDISRSTHRPICRSTCRPTYRLKGAQTTHDPMYMSAGIAVEYRSTCRPTYQSRGAQTTHDPMLLQSYCDIGFETRQIYEVCL